MKILVCPLFIRNLLIPVLGLLLLAGCGSLEKRWSYVSKVDRTPNYRWFVSDYPDSKYTPVALARISELEVLDWEKASISTDPLSDYRWYVRNYPDSPHLAEAKERITELSKDAWEQARGEDKVDAYKKFLKDYPDSAFSQDASERLAWLRENKAVVRIEYPRVIRTGFIYDWTTMFYETSGHAGFSLGWKSADIICPRRSYGWHSYATGKISCRGG